MEKMEKTSTQKPCTLTIHSTAKVFVPVTLLSSQTDFLVAPAATNKRKSHSNQNPAAWKGV